MAFGRLSFWAALSLAAAIVLPAQAHAQSNLSEHLSATMMQARNSDLHRRFGRALIDDGRDLEIDTAAGVDEVRRTLLRRASLYETVSDYAKAEGDLTSAAELSPPSATVIAARGYFYMRRGRFADALKDFLASADIEPNNPRWRFAAGRVQSALGNFSAAVVFYDEAIRLGPRDPTFYVARAEARLRLADPRRARDDYDRALDIRLPRPTDRYYAYLGRGYALLMLADYEAAIADFDSALAIEPRALSALMWRGYAREKDGQTALALADYERAVRADPDDRTARANLQRLRSN